MIGLVAVTTFIALGLLFVFCIFFVISWLRYRGWLGYQVKDHLVPYSDRARALAAAQERRMAINRFLSEFGVSISSERPSVPRVEFLEIPPGIPGGPEARTRAFEFDEDAYWQASRLAL